MVVVYIILLVWLAVSMDGSMCVEIRYIIVVYHRIVDFLNFFAWLYSGLM